MKTLIPSIILVFLVGVAAYYAGARRRVVPRQSDATGVVATQDNDVIEVKSDWPVWRFDHATEFVDELKRRQCPDQLIEDIIVAEIAKHTGRQLTNQAG